MQRRIDAHVAAFGEQNRDKIIAVPSETGQGVHLFFDPERSLSPEPGRDIEPRQPIEFKQEAIVMDDSESDGSDSSLETVDRVTYRSGLWPSSPPSPCAPKAPRYITHGNWVEGTMPSSLSAVDSLELLAERRQAMRSQRDGVQAYQRVMEEQGRLTGRNAMREQAEQEERNRREQILSLRRDYEQRVEEFREERWELFGSQDGSGSDGRSRTGMETNDGNDSPELSRPPSPAGPSRRAQQRRHEAEQIVTPKLRPQDHAVAHLAADGPFVVVAKRGPKLGPSGTVVIDHETGRDMVETKRYRVRADELQSIDGDGDSVMGSDEYYVCDSPAI
jgi:hypothetical protein